MDKIARPAPEEIPDYFKKYVEKVPEGDLLVLMDSDHRQTNALLGSLPEEVLGYRYAPGKWTIREIVSHLTDGERVFAYRAMRFARGDATELAGFDENSYVPESNALSRPIGALLREWDAVRDASRELFAGMTPAMLLRTGVASKNRISVRALGYVILGHEWHHRHVIHERYLKR